MKLKVLKDFEWAHKNVHIKPYVKGQVIETDDEDLIRVAKYEKWAGEAKDADVAAQVKALQDDIAALQQKLDTAEDEEIAGINAELAEKQAAIDALQA